LAQEETTLVCRLIDLSAFVSFVFRAEPLQVGTKQTFMGPTLRWHGATGALATCSTSCHSNRTGLRRWIALAVAAAVALVFAALPSTAFVVVPEQHQPSSTGFGVQRSMGRTLCGGLQSRSRSAPASGHFTGSPLRPEHVLSLTAAAAAVSLLNPRTWTATPTFPVQDYTKRQWTRQYRILGLDNDAPREKVLKAADTLREKYAGDEEAIERIDRASLLIMTRLMSESERKRLERERAEKIKEVLETPKRLLNRYVLSWIPVSIRDMLEVPTAKIFRKSSGLLGVFALLGLCVPNMASSFVGLGAAATMGLVYTRGRPEPVKDSQGNVGEVKKINLKEMGACIALVVASFLLGAGCTAALVELIYADFQVIFCVSTCFILWLVSLFFKVYEAFD